MRTRVTTSLATFALVCSTVLGASAQTDPDVPNWDPTNTACDLYHGVDEAGRTGAFYTNFWPNGIVPYEFEDGTNTNIRGVVLTDVTFRIPFSGPELFSPTGFDSGTFTVGDVIRTNGSQLNDNRNMTITDIQRGPGGDTMMVDTPSFWAEDPTGSAVLVFVNDGVSQARRDLAEAAMAVWEDAANINFVPRTTQTDYILIENDNVNSVRGDVGHGSGQRELVMNAWNSNVALGIFIHELGHSLGLKHEHQRPDRDTYVTIDTTIIQAGTGGNFTLDNSITMYPDLTYDFGSIMHYSRNAFRAQGQTGTVITVNEPWTDDWQNNIGQRNGLSYWDAKTMSFMYPQSNWRFLRQVNLNPPSDGEFQSPWTVFDTAYADTPVGGRLIILNPQSYIEPGVYSKPMIIEAPQGGVTIRAN